jgi:hypothetical protein
MKKQSFEKEQKLIERNNSLKKPKSKGHCCKHINHLKEHLKEDAKKMKRDTIRFMQDK